MRRKIIAATVLTLSLGCGTLAHASSIFGHPNSHSQVGRQGTKNNQRDNNLEGKPNRHNRKKVTSNTHTPMPADMVAAGAKIFSAQCESCHGPGGNGSLSAPRLSSPSPVYSTFKTEAALESFIQAQMPGDHPGTLSAVDVKNVSAYVWSISKAK